MNTKPNQIVAVIGAGSAGLFAARELASNGVQVVLFNRDIKPGGLAEYGIYPTKLKMKEGLRAQFRQILQMPLVRYYGNVLVGENGDLSLEDVRAMGFQATMVTVGAQGTKSLGLPGETLRGVYHAKDLVYHYNQLPPYSEQPFQIGRRVAIIGVGNVMMDIAHYLLEFRDVDEVIAVARRGPGEIKFDKKELEYVVANLDLEAFDAELDRAADLMRSLGQDPEEPKALVRSALEKAVPTKSPARFRLRFLASPVRIIGDEQGCVRGLEIENNTLVEDRGRVKAVGLKTYDTLDVDTVIFAIGDAVDERLGLPRSGTEFCKSKRPSFPVDGLAFEVYDEANDREISGVFVAGWSRQSSTGLVGVARKDGVFGARAVLAYLNTQPPTDVEAVLERVAHRLSRLEKHVVTSKDVTRLEEVERAYAERLGIEEFKFKTNAEMLAAIGLERISE